MEEKKPSSFYLLLDQRKKEFDAINKIEENMRNAIRNAKELIATLEQKCDKQQEEIEVLNTKLNSEKEAVKLHFSDWKKQLRENENLENKLEKIPKWIQKIFIKN